MTEKQKICVSYFTNPSTFSPTVMKRTLCTLSLVGASLLAAGSVFAEQFPFRDQPFPDVPQSHPNYQAIELLRENNIIRGYIDGTFKPTRRISRSELVTLITNPFFIDGLSTDDCIPMNSTAGSKYVFYKDVPTDSWFAPKVCVATVRRIINGFPDNTFRPGEYINFVQVAKIAANVFAFDIKQDENAETWYRPYVKRLADLKAIPTSIKSFNQIMTRAEAAEIIYRLKTNDQTKASATFESLKF